MKSRQLTDKGRILCCHFGEALYLCTFLGLWISPVLTYMNYLRASRLSFLFFLLSGILAHIFSFVGRKAFSNKIVLQMFSLFALLGIYLACALANANVRANVYALYLVCAEFAFVLIGLLVWLVQIPWKTAISSVYKYLRNHFVLFCICAIWLLLCLEALHSWINWDSATYYRHIANLKNITLSPNDIAMFKTSGHASYGYMLFASIGEFLLPDFGVGVRLINIGMLLVSFWAFYSILNTLFPKSKIWNYFAVVIFAVTPLVMGPVYEIHLETAMLFFFIMFVWSYLNGYYIWQLLFGVFFVFSKENAVFILAGFALGYFIYILWVHRKKYSLSMFFEKKTFINLMTFYIPALLFLVYFVFDGSGWAVNATITTGESEQIHRFGWNVLYFVSKLKQLYLFNFEWIIVCICVCGMVYLILKKKLQLNQSVLFPMLGSYMMFLIFQLFYVTYLFPRYTVLQYFFGTLLLAYILSHIPLRKASVSFFTGVIVLLLVENFVTIDFVTLGCFKNINIGNGKMAPASVILSWDDGLLVSGEDAEIMMLSPYTPYNRQYLYKFRLMERVLQTLDYTSDDLLIFPDLFPPISNGAYWGYNSENYYDTSNGRIFQLYEPIQIEKQNLTRIKYWILGEDSPASDVSAYRNVYYLQFPYSESFDDEKILENYSTQFLQEVNYRGWSVKIYQIGV